MKTTIFTSVITTLIVNLFIGSAIFWVALAILGTVYLFKKIGNRTHEIYTEKGYKESCHICDYIVAPVGVLKCALEMDVSLKSWLPKWKINFPKIRSPFYFEKSVDNS